jgi:hypothetical protein
MRKNKARFCVQGDKHIAGLDYFECYAPVVSWSTMNLAVQQGWATRQVDFSNAFVQAELKEEVYMELPEMFRDKQNHGNKHGVVFQAKQVTLRTSSGPLILVQPLTKGTQRTLI